MGVENVPVAEELSHTDSLKISCHSPTTTASSRIYGR